MDAPLSVLLRNGSHAGASVRLALKAEQVSISYARSVIQIPVVQLAPIIMDLGMVRPSLTISGLVDTVGGDQTNTTAGFQGMESFVLTGPNAAGNGTEQQTYYMPYKNYLENKLVTWISDDGYDPQLEIGNAETPEGADQTGGGSYKVFVQQIQFSGAPAMEDRWVYSVQFAGKFRSDITF